MIVSTNTDMKLLYLHPLNSVPVTPGIAVHTLMPAGNLCRDEVKQYIKER